MYANPERDPEYPRERRAHSAALGSRTFLAIALIAAGLLLFLGNLGLFPLRSVWQLWPLGLIALGMGRWIEDRSATGRVWSALLVVFGSVFLCISLGFLHLHAHGSWPIAIVLIFSGILSLTRALESPVARRARVCHTEPGTLTADFLRDTAVLSAVQRRIESVDFKGGLLTCVLGSIELDLRRVQTLMPNQEVILETACVLGSIKLRVPESWRVAIIGVPVLGAYEDKTIPMSRPDIASGTLVVGGSCVLGSIEIEN